MRVFSYASLGLTGFYAAVKFGQAHDPYSEQHNLHAHLSALVIPMYGLVRGFIKMDDLPAGMLMYFLRYMAGTAMDHAVKEYALNAIPAPAPSHA